MALQVWLPLNGDLHNQGLSNLTITNNGATIDNSGKIGKCYSINDVIDLGYSGSNLNTNSISLCCWVRFNTNDIASIINNQTYTSTYKSSNGNILGNNAYGGFSLQWYSNDIYTSGSFSSISVQCYLRTSTVGAKATSSINLPLDTWNHLCAICDKTSNKCSLYLNGSLQAFFNFNTFTDATDRTFKLNYRATAGGNFYTPQIPILMNDVRIYDHALSAKEIKEIYKTLILHYKLDDPYLEATTNLVTREDGLSNTCYNGATGKYGYGSTTDIYKDLGSFNGRYCTKVYMGTAGLSAYPYVYFDAFNTVGTNIQTLSFDYYPTSQDKIIPYSYNGNYNFSYTTSAGVTGSATNVGSVTIPVIVNQWNHITITAQKYDTTNTTRGNGYIRIGNAAHTSTTTNYWLFSNVQVENKDHETGYAGCNGTRSDIIVYDSSGHNNNGELYAYDNNGSIETTTDTPRYTLSTFINSANNTTNTASGTRYIYGHCALTNPTVMSVAFWCKPIAGYGGGTGQGQFCTTNYEFGNTNVGSDYQGSAMNHRDSTIDINDSTSTTQCRPSFLPTANEWHHYVITYDGQNGKVYKDGVQSSTASFSTTKTLDSFIGVVIGFSKAGGVWRSNQSYFSDFRIYATCLTIDDIKELYRNSMLISGTTKKPRDLE